MIPKFPNFKKLELSDKREIEKFASKFPPYSTFNFINLWSWDTRNDRKVSKLNGNLVVLFTDYTTKKPFLSFLGTSKCANTAFALLHFAQKSKISPKLRFVTEESVQHLHSVNLKIEEDRGNFDYLFSPHELATLQGKKFKEQRHLAKRFLKECPEAIFQLRNLSELPVQNKIRLVLRQWKDRKKLQNKTCDLRFEKRALGRLLETAADHNLTLSGVFLKNEMLGFSIDEISPGRNAMAHFIKADNSFKGIYEFLNRALARYLVTLDVPLWNWQQDLDLKNLRETKVGYRPTAFLKKYTVSVVPNKRPKNKVINTQEKTRNSSTQNLSHKTP